MSDPATTPGDAEPLGERLESIYECTGCGHRLGHDPKEFPSSPVCTLRCVDCGDDGYYRRIESPGDRSDGGAAWGPDPMP